MTPPRRSNRVRIVFALAVCAVLASDSESMGGNSPPAKKARVDDPNSPDYRVPSVEHRGGTERDKLVADTKKTLNAMKPPYGKKEEGDLFVVGTIELRDHHASVDFVIQEGVQKAAEFIADFVLGKTPGEIREWRAFNRAKAMKNAEVLRAKAKAESVEGKLTAFKLDTKGKKSPDDYFVVGTADLNTNTLHADIRFEILNGIKATADFIIDFILNRPKDHTGEWHVFYRAHTEAQATDYRQQMRDWYDNLQSQRSRIAAIYNAKTTARC